jgi:hypothetical protein
VVAQGCDPSHLGGTGLRPELAGGKNTRHYLKNNLQQKALAGGMA